MTVRETVNLLRRYVRAGHGDSQFYVWDINKAHVNYRLATDYELTKIREHIAPSTVALPIKPDYGKQKHETTT